MPTRATPRNRFFAAIAQSLTAFERVDYCGDRHLPGRSFPSPGKPLSDYRFVIGIQACQRFGPLREKATTDFRSCLHFSRPRGWLTDCLTCGMRNVLALALAVTLGLSPTVLAAGQQVVTITGRAMSPDHEGLANATVRLRSVTSGQLQRVTTSGQGGNYEFPAVAPDTYIIELVDRNGRMLGTTEPFLVEAGTAATMSVVATSTSALAAAGSAGFSFLGLGPAMSTVVLGAAGAAAIAGVVAMRPEASPSN